MVKRSLSSFITSYALALNYNEMSGRPLIQDRDVETIASVVISILTHCSRLNP